MKCPRCGGKDTAPIMYGMPAFDDELERALADHKIVLGGCCISDADPKYHCFQCNKDFGTPPVLLSKRGLERYEDIITSIRFSDGGFFSAKLYEKLYIQDWKKRFVDPCVLDGEQWELEIHLAGGRKRTYYGSNAYPPLWKELKNVFRPYFNEVGIRL